MGLTYDSERRLTAWQNTPSSPTSTDAFLYDGEGRRVQQQTVSGGTTTTTTYVSDIEQVAAVSGGATTTTTYYQAMDKPIALAVNGALSYLASDTLSSVTVALDANGNVTANQLFFPYGSSRYSSGTMPTDKGFTGQHADGATGLDYYNARYYDPVAGQFASADTQRDGFNRYVYVQGNPTTHTDPSGHCYPLCTMIIGAVVGAVIGAASVLPRRSHRASRWTGVRWVSRLRWARSRER